MAWATSPSRFKPTFRVSNLHLQRWGIERRTKSRALKALSDAGLITVVGRGKRSPMVTIVVAGKEGGGSNDLHRSAPPDEGVSPEEKCPL
jgi:DNA-binding transcriptional ArsR family regulator